jgi:hypothetical protein
MRTILNKKQKDLFINNNWINTTLCFNWGKTGMRQVTILNARGERTQFKAGGCGYDKQGAAFGDYITHFFNDEIKRLKSSDFYGLTHYNTKTKKRQERASKHTQTYLDGACGFDCMRRIFERIGFDLNFIYEDKNTLTYQVEAN